MKFGLRKILLLIKSKALPVFLCGLLVVSSVVHCVGQTKGIDAARTKILTGGKDAKFSNIMELLKLKNSLSNDSLRKYVLLAELTKPKKIGKEDLYNLTYYKTLVLLKEAPFERAKFVCDSLINVMKREKAEHVGLLKIMHLKATLLVRNSKYEEAISSFFQVLKMAEKLNNKEFIVAGNNGVGWVYMEMENYNQAIGWFRKAIDTAGDTTFLKNFTVLMQNMAATFNSIHQNDSALKYLVPSINFAVEVEDLRSQANGYAIMADILIDLNKKEEAAVSLNKALEIRKKIGDVYYILSDMYQLAVFYASVKRCDEGINIAREGLALAKKTNTVSKYMILYEALAENYKSCGDMKEYAAVLENMIAMKDSINKVVSANALAEMSAKYDLEKKEQQIVRQELLLSRKNYLTYGSIVLLLLVIIIGVQYFRYYSHKQQSLSLLGVSKAREEERNRIAAELHDNIGTQLGYISRKIDFVREKGDGGKMENAIVLDDINTSARKAIADLRETIWALKKDQVKLRELADRLKVYAQKQFSPHPEVQVMIKENFDRDVLFTSTDSLNVFRIMQEAIYNAAHHSSGFTVSLLFESFMDGSWKLVVADDGKGFNTNEKFENHFGLENMIQRSKDIGAILDIKSELGKGTIVTLHKGSIVA